MQIDTIRMPIIARVPKARYLLIPSILIRVPNSTSDIGMERMP